MIGGNLEHTHVNGASDYLISLIGKKEDLHNLVGKANYVSFTISKKNGKYRWIDSPSNQLKEIQNNILYKIIYKVKPHKCSYGFIRGKSPKTNAENHLYGGDKKVVLMLDIDNFFNSITYNQIISAFYYLVDNLYKKSNKHQELSRCLIKDSTLLANLCSYFNTLPQGAPTSPALANVITYSMDDELDKLAKDNGLTYTRYADDLAFSTTDMSFNYDSFIKSVRAIISINGFNVNNDKVRILRPHRRQSITGVVVNNKLSVSKRYYKNIRAGVHNYVHGKLTDKKEVEKLRGKIEWIKSVNPKKGLILLNKFNSKK